MTKAEEREELARAIEPFLSQWARKDGHTKAADAIQALGYRRLPGDGSIEAAAQAPTWLPIESAPKDGRDIIGFVPSPYFPEGRIVVLSWRDDDFAREFAWLDHSHDDYSTGWNSTPFDPTHWMPLPSPPHDGAHAVAPSPPVKKEDVL